MVMAYWHVEESNLGMEVRDEKNLELSILFVCFFIPSLFIYLFFCFLLLLKNTVCSRFQKKKCSNFFIKFRN
jgi:hypothetical protein